MSYTATNERPTMARIDCYGFRTFNDGTDNHSDTLYMLNDTVYCQTCVLRIVTHLHAVTYPLLDRAVSIRAVK